MKNRHGFLLVSSSLCPCPNRLLCFPFSQGPSWLFRKFSIRELRLNSAGMSNRDLERERPRIELNSHPGLPCVGGYKDITQSPGKVLWLGQNLGAGWGWGTMYPNLFIVGTLVGSGV